MCARASAIVKLFLTSSVEWAIDHLNKQHPTKQHVAPIRDHQCVCSFILSRSPFQSALRWHVFYPSSLPPILANTVSICICCVQSKIAAYRERSKAMGEQIFGVARVAAAVSKEETSDFRQDLSSPSYLVDIDTEAMPSTGLGGEYSVADGIRVGLRDGSLRGDQEEGRRRHDLSLVSDIFPVFLRLKRCYFALISSC